MRKQWSEYSLQQQTAFSIGMLLAGILASAGLYLGDRSDAAVMVGMVFAGASIGVLISLRQRLAGLSSRATRP